MPVPLVAQGGTIPLDVVFTHGAGEPVDPVEPRLRVITPSEVVAFDADVTDERVELGRWDHPFPVPVDAEVGLWRAEWTAIIDGALAGPAVDFFEVVVAAAIGLPGEPLYGASVDDVKALVPDWVPRAGQRPTEDDVAEWLGEFSGRVARRLGNLAGLDVLQLAEVNNAAKGLVVLGAASRLVAARTPAKAGKNDTSYDGLLWKWYEEGLAELAGDVELLRQVDVDVEAAQGSPAGAVGSFPAPLFANPSLVGPRLPGSAPLGNARLTDPHRY